jgi:preprotein translocase subunit SecD
MSASLLWVVVSYLSVSRGLALTLAGVVGLIVSIGVSLDSNVIFFEDLKDVYRRGDSLSLAVNKSFPGAFSTVFWANLATLIGALILYLLTVGSVKGFALILAIASVLDLVATYFFMAPLVRLLVDRFADKPALFGIRSARNQEEVPA